jgi:hypothetical protein
MCDHLAVRHHSFHERAGESRSEKSAEGGKLTMKENQETISNDRKPQGMASVPPRAKESEDNQHKGEQKKKPKLDRLSRAAGQRK